MTDGSGHQAAGGTAKATVRVRLADVAAEAGVAISTVSRVFSKPTRVNFQTAERVRQVADRLGYRPRPDRTATAGNPSDTENDRGRGIIAFLTQDTADGISSQILKGAQREAIASGCAVSVIETGPSAPRSESLLRLLMDRTDGIIIANNELTAESIHRTARRLPTVVVNRPVEGVPSIVPDPTMGVTRALLALKRFHHRSIVYVSGIDGLWADHSRWACLETIGRSLGFKTHRIGPVKANVEGGVQAAAAVEDRLPDAIIAYNDLIAAGLALRLQADGLRIPGDLSVIGFDNTLIAPVVSPSITTIRIPRAQIGQAAVDTLLGRQVRHAPSSRDNQLKMWLTAHGLSPQEASPELIPVDTSLIMRRSTGERGAQRHLISSLLEVV
ncbi:oligogalacturonide transporter [Bifidobacterium actinocoloniiforme DSM 22766]|uniref:Oligogalacturonide transporter n=1 Tax=Bifidobacterium actinocoloniiforme DSM 22766 TaxID=1437605 RepID=A0A086Z2K3_9BIFI|nr:LacI family DNA-binding transcriptional regulator [Bifidobacterium actinocoloniiforme]KFI40753.1 oligogalacturonide transporter [Bifidobacterium actinocoloniiforme DSM 22766]